MANESESRLIIAIDFGTTFTGVAYYPSPPRSVPPDAQQIARDIQVVSDWPSTTTRSFKEKIPSIIAYNTDPPLWGRQVTPDDQPQEAHFKLDLEPKTRRIYPPSTADEGRGQRNRTPLAITGTGQRLPLDITADYLTCVYTHVRDVFFRSRYGQNYLQSQEVSFVLTVPAIWTDYAENLTKMAATRAGITDELTLISEPEAAALYCATKCEELELKQGDRFLVCDAGGGTVVLYIQEMS
jgi:molecular chaperone DnaK (HSP70)